MGRDMNMDVVKARTEQLGVQSQEGQFSEHAHASTTGGFS